MSAEPIDFAAVKARHEKHWSSGEEECIRYAAPGPGLKRCLPYCLAKAASDLTDKVARVESLIPTSHEIRTYRRNDWVESGHLRAALADRPEQVQP